MMIEIEPERFVKQVMVVDDEDIICTVLRQTIELSGFDVTTVGSAEEALDALPKHPPGCLIADKNPPGKDGVELIAEVRKLLPYCACIVVTGYVSQESLLRALRIGTLDRLLRENLNLLKGGPDR